MSQNIRIMGADFSDVPSVDISKVGGGLARFSDPSITTAVESDVTSGKIFLKVDGSLGVGSKTFSTIRTGSTAPSSSLGVDGDVYIQV